MPGKLVLCRHGQSIWNLENLFTGWVDVDLTAQGRAEAAEAGRQLVALGLQFDFAYTSVLKRAIRTLWIILDGMDRMWIPVERDWRLNERHYGALQGLDKAATTGRRPARSAGASTSFQKGMTRATVSLRHSVSGTWPGCSAE